MVARHDFEPLDADCAAALYELTDAMTAAAGLPAYEISNHARHGQEGRHNLAYWRYGDYTGIGPGAHGRRLGMRTVRHRKPENFLSALRRNGNGISEEAELLPNEAADEALVMGLRLGEGLPRSRTDPAVDQAAVARLARAGLVEQTDERLRVTAQGTLLLDAILAELVL
jgi:oxygen-independent coproporphyrinogen-3 oxidase